ncbi:sugar ABC transporter substrate-binding protein [Alphaproteobacteria bacterium KMM 3653]|uniref:Sugar ABC transporter substrate-binding protein n=1 Tax=Harenicola maris TaxID=2841044 RepID=A0AAP2CTA1_9RHOB|nr:sugar ABC transporter substrate-binding protein [Harenicola maris]
MNTTLKTLMLGTAAALSLSANAQAQDAPVVGILGANYAIESARAQYEALAAGLKEQGIEFRFLDAQLDINRQVSQIDQFVNEGVDAIVVNVAGDPNAVLGPLNRAEEAGVMVFSIGATPGFEATLVQADLPSEELGRLSGEYICAETGGTGQIAMIEAIDIPVLAARWDSFTTAIEANCPALDIVARERAIPDDAATARPIAENLLTRFPEIKAIWTMGDGPALGAALAVKSAGRDVIVTGLNGEEQGAQGVQQGVVDATWDMLPVQIGYQLSQKIAAILKGEAEAPSETEVFTVTDLPIWSAETIADWKAYDDRIDYPGIQ